MSSLRRTRLPSKSKSFRVMKLLRLGTEGCTQQTNRVQILQPLAIHYVALAPRHMLHMTSIH